MWINDTTERDDKIHGKFKHPDKPPIRYAGVKSQLFKKYDINGFFPEEKPSAFVDMFTGSTSVALWVRERWPDVPIICNDSNTELMKMFRVIADHYPEMAKLNEGFRVEYKRLGNVEDRKKHYYEVRQKYLDDQFANEVEQSAMLLHMLRTNFNGFFGSGLKKYPGKYSGTAGVMIWNADGTLFDPKRLEKFSNYLKTFVLSIGDFEDATAQYIQEGAWFYADPPYRLSTTQYHEKGCADDDIQLKLMRYMRELDSKGVKVAMSNREHYDLGGVKWRLTPHGKDHVSGLWFGTHFGEAWSCNLFKHKYTSGRHNKGDGVKTTEILIKNY